MSENTSKGSFAWMLGLLVLHAICGVAVLWLLLKFVPQYEKIFKDFNTHLPTATLLVIDLSRLFTRLWHVLVPGLAMAGLASMLLLHRAGQPALMTAWGVLVLLAEMLLIGAILEATIVPLNNLIMNLSGGK